MRTLIVIALCLAAFSCSSKKITQSNHQSELSVKTGLISRLDSMAIDISRWQNMHIDSVDILIEKDTVVRHVYVNVRGVNLSDSNKLAAERTSTVTRCDSLFKASEYVSHRKETPRQSSSAILGWLAALIILILLIKTIAAK